MPAIHQIVPDPEMLLALEIPEAAFVLLQNLASNNSDGSSSHGPAFLGNMFSEYVHPANGNIAADHNAGKFKEAITEHLLAA